MHFSSVKHTYLKATFTCAMPNSIEFQPKLSKNYQKKKLRILSGSIYFPPLLKNPVLVIIITVGKKNESYLSARKSTLETGGTSINWVTNNVCVCVCPFYKPKIGSLPSSALFLVHTLILHTIFHTRGTDWAEMEYNIPKYILMVIRSRPLLRFSRGNTFLIC